MQYQEILNKLNNHTSQEDLKILFDDIYNMCQVQQFKLDEIIEIVSKILKMDTMRFDNELKDKCWNALRSARLRYPIYALFDWRPIMRMQIPMEDDIEAYVDQCISALTLSRIANEAQLSSSL